MNLNNIKENPDNPRYIDSNDLQRLSESISKFPKMMEMRPIIVDDKGIILGGNMRFRAFRL